MGLAGSFRGLEKANLRLSCLFLLGLSVASLVVGVHDTLSAAELVDRSYGLIMTLAGLLMLLGSVALLPVLHKRLPSSLDHLGLSEGTSARLRKGLPFAIAGLASSLGTSLVLALPEFEAQGFSWRVVAWAALAANSLVSTAVLVAHYRPRIAVKRAVSATVAAGLIGAVLQWWWLNAYLPIAAEPVVTTTLDLYDEGEQSAADGRVMQAIGVDVVMKSNGETKARMLGGVLTVVAWHNHLDALPGDSAIERYNNLSDLAVSGRQRQVEAYNATSDAELIYFLLFDDVGGFIGPHDELVDRHVVYVPKGTFTTITAHARRVSGRANRLDVLPRSDWQTEPNGAGDASPRVMERVWRIASPTWISKLTSGPRGIVQVVRFPDPQQDVDPAYSVSYGRLRTLDKGGSSDQDFGRLTRVYGISSNDAFINGSLGRLPAVPAKDASSAGTR